MSVLTREALLGASDLRSEEVELPTLGGSVVVQGLSAAYSNEAQSEAMEIFSDGRGQRARINTKTLECLQVLHGLLEPKLNSLAEAEQFMKQCGPAARTVVDTIDELSGIDKEAIAAAEQRFPDSGEAAAGAEEPGDGAGAGDGGPDLPPRTGSEAG